MPTEKQTHSIITHTVYTHWERKSRWEQTEGVQACDWNAISARARESERDKREDSAAQGRLQNVLEEEVIDWIRGICVYGDQEWVQVAVMFVVGGGGVGGGDDARVYDLL